MVAPCQLSLRRDVVPEDPAVVDHACDHPDPVTSRRIEAELTRPGLEGVEDDHRPVDCIAEALEAANQVQGETVGRPRRDADPVGEPGFAKGRHALPDLLALVAGPVGIVEQEEIEAVLPQALQAALRRRPQIIVVSTGPPQRRIGEAWEALRAVALALVEVVADGPDEAVVVPRNALE